MNNEAVPVLFVDGPTGCRASARSSRHSNHSSFVSSPLSQTAAAARGRIGRLMVRALVGLSVGLLLCCGAPRASAAPPYQQFLEGLRNRGYFDMALLQLDRLAEDANAPAEIKAVVDYERAITLIAYSQTGTDPATQTKRLDEATAAMERFVQANPNHPLSAQAQTERGKILIGKARVSIMEANSPGNEGQAAAIREEGRKFLADARTIFESARAKYDEQWKSFGPFVDEQSTAERAQRNEALNALIQSRLNLAECTYREAQTYPEMDAKRAELLDAAADQYEAIHADYRSQIGGLFARMWMGKCYEEQAPRPGSNQTLNPQQTARAREMLNIAEAIYTELLEHDTSGAASAARMQEYAFWFKLIVRNHPVLSDHQLVVNLATEWIDGRRGAQARSVVAQGVRWERAQAFESLANKPDLPEAERARLLRSSLADAEFVNAFPGEYRDVSRAMIQRVKASLGRGEGDPQDFDSANGLAQTLHNQIGERQRAIDAAKTPEEKTKAQEAFASHLNETARVLRLALSFAGPGTDRSALNAARYRLAYAEYQLGNFYDAAVLGSYVGSKFYEESPQIALDAAYLGMAAFYKLYDTAGPDGKDFAMAKLRSTADFIAANFPDSEQANESRMMLGRLFMDEGEFQQAAEWFSKVPSSSGEAREARLLAGRAFWDSYFVNQRLPEEARPPAEELDKLAADAEKFLREGLDLAKKQIPAESPAPEEVIAGKATLAQITNLNGNYQEAVDLISAAPHAVLAAIEVPPNTARPKVGVKSGPFATLVHQQLLRAFIGLQQMDPAIAQMEILQKIGGEGNTAVFVDLGRQIKEELERLPEGPEREKVMTAFEMFLDNLSKMQQGQTFSSLVWIGETYFGLAQAATEPKRSTYYDQAAKSYESILARSSEAGFVPSPEAAIGVRLRLASVTANRGDFEKSYELARQVLKEVPQALNAQVETANILKEWGNSGVTEAPEKLLLSIQGDRSDNVFVWGWGQIAQRLQRTLESNPDNEEFKELYRQARYEIPLARRAYAKTQPNQEKFQEAINRAEKELTTFTSTTPQEEIGPEWWAQFEALYAGIQQDQGVAVPKQLEPAKVYASEPAAATTVAATPASNPAAAPPATAAPATQAPPEPASPLPMIFGLVLAGGAVGGVLFAMFRGNKRRPTRVTPERLPTMPVTPPSDSSSRRSDKARSARRAEAVEGAPVVKPSRTSSSTSKDATRTSSSRSSSSSSSDRASKERERSSSREGASAKAPLPGRRVSSSRTEGEAEVKKSASSSRRVESSTSGSERAEGATKPPVVKPQGRRVEEGGAPAKPTLPKKPRPSVPEGGETAEGAKEVPKVVKPRAVKNVRRTSPPENP